MCGPDPRPPPPPPLAVPAQVARKFGLRERAGACPQTYGLGLKEVWEVRARAAPPGAVLRMLVAMRAACITAPHAPPPHQVAPDKHRPGTVWHTVGYPLPWDVYGGGWVYHWADNKVSLG